MQFQVERDTLAEAVAWTARALPGRPANPILAGMRIDATTSTPPDGGTVTLSGFNVDGAARMSLDAAVGTPGSVLVSGRLLAEICHALPAQRINVSVDGTKVVLRCAGSRFTLQTMLVEDYPRLPAMPALAGTVGSDLFAAALAQVTVAASRDATVPILAGVRIEMDGVRLRLACTDRYRIAVRELPWQAARADVATLVLVPARALAGMARSWTGDAEVAIHLAGDGTDAIIGFECGTRRSISRLLEDHFLDYLSRFPTEYASAAEVPTTAFIDAVRRVALVARRSAPIHFAFRRDEVVLEAATGEEAHALEVLPITYHGEPMRIAFNAQYLLEGLAALDSDTARISLSTPAKAALLTGKSGADQTSDGYRYLLMPIRLS